MLSLNVPEGEREQKKQEVEVGKSGAGGYLFVRREDAGREPILIRAGEAVYSPSYLRDFSLLMSQHCPFFEVKKKTREILDPSVAGG